MEQTRTELRMGEMNVQRLLVTSSVPLMLSLLLNTLYNTVDSIFIAQINEEALTAVSLAAPMQMIMSALGAGLALGLNAVISKSLGEKNRAAVKETASAAMFLALCASVLLAVLGFFVVEPFFAWQSAGNAQIAEYGRTYLSICMLCAFGQMAQFVFDRFLITTGRAMLFLVTLGTASVVNLILDPILIFGFFGLPAMGTAGAAVATVIGQITGGTLGYFINKHQNKEIPLHFTLRPNGGRILQILRVGIPTALMQGIVSVAGIALNTVLTLFSSTAVAVFGVCARIQNLAYIMPNGVCLGLVPIVAFNFGAAKPSRIRAALRWAIIDSAVALAALLLIIESLPSQILMLFNASEHMLELGVPALRILAVGCLLSVPGVVLSSFFQALGRAMYSMILTLLRQAILLLPCVLLFAQLGDVTFVWCAYIAAELLALPVGILLYRRVRRECVLPLEGK